MRLLFLHSNSIHTKKKIQCRLSTSTDARAHIHAPACSKSHTERWKEGTVKVYWTAEVKAPPTVQQCSLADARRSRWVPVLQQR